MRLILYGIVLLSLVACSQAQDDAIRFGIASAASNLDPRLATDATSSRVLRLLYRRLVDFDEQSRPIPDLAHWEMLTPTRYRFTLTSGDEGRWFHDGSRLRAEDVAATYESLLDPSLASPHRGSLALIERMEVLDENRLDFVLRQADPLFPGYLGIGIVPASAVKSGFPLHKQALGSGPFRLLSWNENGGLHLVRQRDQQVFHFLEIKDPTVRVLKLLRGEIHLLQNDLPAELRQYLQGQAGLQVETGPGSNFSYIGFNLQDPHTGKGEVRQAIAQAIDRDAVIRHVLYGAARPASALLPPQHWAGREDLPAIQYDPQAARKALTAAGYGPGNPLTLQYKTSADPLRLRIATVFQRQLAEIGVQVKLQSYDWGTFYGDIKAGRFQMYSLAWVGIQTPDIFRFAFHSDSLPPDGANRGRLNDAQVNALIEQAEMAVQLEQQARFYGVLQKRLLDLLPYIPLWYEDQFYAMRNEIQGYRLAPDGNYDALQQVHRVATEAKAR